MKAEVDTLTATARKLLRDERESQESSLADLRARTEFTRAALCRFENDEDANPTLRTLALYAAALGNRVSIELTD